MVIIERTMLMVLVILTVFFVKVADNEALLQDVPGVEAVVWDGLKLTSMANANLLLQALCKNSELGA